MKQGVIRPCISGNKNKGEQSLRTSKVNPATAQLIALREFPDHNIGTGNPDRI